MEIRPLVPQLADDFVSLFDAAFSDNPYWMGCYCAYYDDPCSDDQWKASADAAPAHREARCERIRAGQANGLLAYDDESVVGWCNVGPRNTFVNLRAYAEAVEPGDAPTGSIMCFVVHPEHRHRGVATALLERADDYLRGIGWPPQRATRGRAAHRSRLPVDRRVVQGNAGDVRAGRLPPPSRARALPGDAQGPVSAVREALLGRHHRRLDHVDVSTVETAAGARGQALSHAGGLIEVQSIVVVHTSEITSADALASGYSSARDLVADLRGTADSPIYRIRSATSTIRILVTSWRVQRRVVRRRRERHSGPARAHGPTQRAGPWTWRCFA